jgi:hypothetical protein
LHPATYHRWCQTIVLVTLWFCCNALAACGGDAGSLAARKSPEATVEAGSPATYTRSPDGYVEGDEDTDDLYHSHRDSDDKGVRRYGHEAQVRGLLAVRRLVELYYRAAADEDGVRACALVYRSLARSRDLEGAVPKAYASAADSSLFHGASCARIESTLFEINHQDLAAGAGSVTVTSLRIKGDRGIALLAFKTMPELQIAVRRERGQWKIDRLLAEEIT